MTQRSPVVMVDGTSLATTKLVKRTGLFDWIESPVISSNVLQEQGGGSGNV